MQILKVIQQRGWTLERVAREMGIQKGTLSDSISKMPNVRRLIDIANIIDCSPADFFADWATAEENTRRVVAAAPNEEITNNNEEQAEQTPMEEEPTKEAPDASGLPFGGEDADPAPSPAPTGVGSGCAETGAEAKSSLFTLHSSLKAAIVCPHCGHAIGIGVTDLGQG